MTPDYTLSPSRLRSLRSALKRALNSNNPRRVLDTVARAYQYFEAEGWPDDWSNWQRAKDDAELSLRLSKPGRIP